MTHHSEPTAEQQHALVGLYNAGRFSEAIAFAHDLTQQYPRDGFAWKVLGALYKQLGRASDALVAMQQAVELSPSDPEAHNNLALVLKSAGLLAAAEAHLQRALVLNPSFAAAHNNLGTVLHEQGHRAEALISYHTALANNPNYAEAYGNLGNTLRDLGETAQAVAAFQRAIGIKPNVADLHNGLGTALCKQGNLQEAVQSYQRALQLDPGSAATHSNLANALLDLGLLDPAESSARAALALAPDFPDAHNNLGNILKARGRLDAAIESYTRALTLMPNLANAHNNLGTVWQDIGQLEAARSSFKTAATLDPDYDVPRSNLLFIANYLEHASRDQRYEEAREYGQWVAQRAEPYTSWPNSPVTNRCLKVGFVSGDLYNHPVGYFIESVLAALKKNAADRVELFVYLSQTRTDLVTARIQGLCSGWCLVAGLTDAALASQIRADGIDILIDLSGHTAANRLPMFAWKPAPVQVSWLGYFATTGVADIDYLIADPVTLPPSEEAHFTETIWRLPETRLCFTPPDVSLPVASAPCVLNGYITFGCFNNLTKINDAVVALWARVLLAIPDSRLFLKAKQLKDASVHQVIQTRFAARGIDPGRLILEGPAAREEYLAAYSRVDIVLDTFPFPGGTTSFESLWMGVPVLTVAGQSFLGRQGVGILLNAGLPHWIATNADDYVAKAIAHSSDLPRLALLRSGLRQQVLASPIFDAPRFAQHFEEALRGMWQIWVSK